MVGVGACAGTSGPDAGSEATAVPESSSTLPPTKTTTVTTTTSPFLSGVPAEFGRAVVELGGVPLTVAVADTDEERRQGLMLVEEVSPLDGMLFVFEDEQPRFFWMKNTLIPLDIAFFDKNGFLVNQTTMEPCLQDTDRCPTYSSDGAAQYAIETPLGRLGELSADARLVIIGALDGSGKEI